MIRVATSGENRPRISFKDIASRQLDVITILEPGRWRITDSNRARQSGSKEKRLEVLRRSTPSKSRNIIRSTRVTQENYEHELNPANALDIESCYALGKQFWGFCSQVAKRYFKKFFFQ
jgi:hypothetical protein